MQAGAGLALGAGALVSSEEHGAEGLSCPTCSGTRGIQAPCRVPLLQGTGPGPTSGRWSLLRGSGSRRCLGQTGSLSSPGPSHSGPGLGVPALGVVGNEDFGFLAHLST